MQVSQQELTKLKKIDTLFDEINTIYSEIPSDLKEKFSDFHSEEFSLDHCVRWGSKAVEELYTECAKDTKSLLDTFREHCLKKADEAGEKYAAQHTDKYIVTDQTWDYLRDDCNLYSRTADFFIDTYPEWFEQCETIADCEGVLEEKESTILFDTDLDDERMNLSYGAAKLDGAVVLEVGSIGRWNGTSHGLNILEVETIGELLTSDCPQWICYVDKETGAFCKSEHHHDGSNYYEYQELTCDKETFEDLLEQAKPGEMAKLVSEHSKSLGLRIADVYGFDLSPKEIKKPGLDEQLSDASALLKESKAVMPTSRMPEKNTPQTER